MSFSPSSLTRATIGQMFTALDGILEKGAAYAAEKNIAEEVVLNWRLAPDMLPMKSQVHIGTEIAARGLSRLAGAEIPSFEGDSTSFADLHARVEKARTIIAALSDEGLDADPDKEITVPFGPQEMTLKRIDFLQNVVLPNLYFHVTATYLALRNIGVDLGKGDFMARP